MKFNRLFTILIITIFLCFPMFAKAAVEKQVSFDKASDIVINDVLQNDTVNKRVYGLNKLLPKGQYIPGWHGGIKTPYDWYLFFIDLHPTANLEHPCLWVMVSTEGKKTVYRNR